MRLYYLQNAVSNSDTCPENPQVQHIEPLLDSDAPNSIYRLYDSFYSFPSLDPTIEYVTLQKGSKFSDILSASMFTLTGFLVSEKLKDLFLNFKLPNYRIYHVPVKAGDTLVNYFWLHMLYMYQSTSFEQIQNNNIDFSRSDFVIEKHLVKISNIQISSIDQLMEKKRELNIGTKVQASTLVLNNAFLDQTPDIFKVPLLGTHWIIKEPLKEAIVKAHFTGIEINEVRNVLVE